MRIWHKVGWPPFVAAKVRLPLAAVITAVLLVISFAPGAQSKGGADLATAPMICRAEMLKNGGLELPVETLGYRGGASTDMARLADPRLTTVEPDSTHPQWKILVLIYDRTDAVVTDTSGVSYNMVGTMARSEVERATLEATKFVETDIPALTSGNMIPELTIRYPEHPLTQLDPFVQGSWWPSPANTAPERDPAFDSIIVIWDPRVVDQFTGTDHWIGWGAGLAVPMGVGQTYATVIIEATGYGHRNVFKHEWGHSILFYFEAVGTSPKPTVTNHAVINQYVHWPTGEAYVWVDEMEANPIPNSIYNNESGFTHDYYSGTTATADQPTRRLGITPEVWMLGGPVTKPLEEQIITASIGDAMKIEGILGVEIMVFEVKLSATSAKTVTLNYATAPGTATESDFVPGNGTITFLPGQIKSDILVQILGDRLCESDETLAVNLSNPNNVNITDAQGIGTIVDNDTPLLATEAPSQRAFAFDALMLREPFLLTNPNYLGTDKRARINLFTLNLILTPGLVVTAEAVDSQQVVHRFPVESVQNVPNFLAIVPEEPFLTQIVLKLPEGIVSAGDLHISISARNKTSNKVLMAVKP